MEDKVMKRTIIGSVVFVIVIVAFVYAYNVSRPFRSVYNGSINTVEHAIVGAARKVGVELPHAHMLEDDEMIIKVNVNNKA